MQAREPVKRSALRSAIIRFSVDPQSQMYSADSTGKFDGGIKKIVYEHYNMIVPSYYSFQETKMVGVIEIGCFDGIRVKRRKDARRRAIAGMLENLKNMYGMANVMCTVNRVLDTRMTSGDYLKTMKVGTTMEGSCIGAGAKRVFSPREAGIGITCPRCGKEATMVRRGDYPQDGEVEAGAAEWRNRGIGGEPRPTLQWMRPHGKCAASNSHSLVLLPAGAPQDEGRCDDFVLAKTFGMSERIPNVYGVC